MNRPPKTKLVAALGGALLALSAASAGAAGLGKLSVNSALGQPLLADIELVSLQPGEFESIAARIASPESYTDAKIEYSPLLRQLRFAVERRSDGKPVLRITSSAPINEPFLDVLVEMNWPAGRLMREYPILLDPPGFNEARVAPPVVATVSPVRPPAAAPSTPAASAPAAAPSSAPVASAPVASPASGTPSAKAESGGDTYGPVKRGDTLNKIAQEMKTDAVSLEQMLVALYRENKSAFVDNNMNRLRTGQILKVPSADEVARIETKDARNEIKVQVASWNAYREQLAGSTASAPAAAPAPTNQASGKISVAKPEAPAAAAPAKDQLKIAKTDTATGKAGGVGASGTGNAQEQINALKEEKIAAQNSLKEANSRVADLEKQIADMRKLLELKGLAGKDGKPVAEPAKVAQVTPAKVEPPKVEPPKVEPPKVEAKPADVKPADSKPADVKPADTKPADAKPAESKVEPPKVEAKPAPKAPVKAPPPPPPEPSFLEEYGLIAGGALASVLGLGGLFAFMSRRKKKGKGGPGGNTSMSKTSSIMPSDLKPNTVTGNRGGGLVDTGNSSFLTDFDKTGPGSIDTDEVDPVAEAEVYIAYGRDAQAEEILKEAMSRDKSRHEITVKLLEIYHARKSVQAFENVARELKGTIGGDNPMWAKVAGMGASIDPQNPLYSGSGQAYETTGAFVAGGSAMLAASNAGDKAPPDVDFDLGFTDSASSGAPNSAFDVTAPTTDQPAAPAMDFDLDLNSGSAAAPEPAGGGLDFDLALDAPAKPAAAPVAAAPAAESSGFDFDLSSLSLDSPDTTKTTPVAQDFTKTIATTAAEHQKTASLSLGDLSLDLDAPAAGGGTAEGPSAVSTKLELAKAYIEIGDSDGAKEILNEVAREGSPAQQEEAKKILAGL
jgi:pilus assembly protein FimV